MGSRSAVVCGKRERESECLFVESRLPCPKVEDGAAPCASRTNKDRFPGYTCDLDGNQWSAVHSSTASLRVIAGPGSGKTRVTVERILRLLDEGESPESVVAVTFTRKAANELRHRLTAAGVGGEVVVGTFHSICLRKIVRKYIGKLRRQTSFFRVLKTTEAKDLLAQAVEEALVGGSQDDMKKHKKWTTHARSHIDTCCGKSGHEVVHQLKVWGVEPFSYNDSLQATVGTCLDSYQSLLQKLNAIDFDDMLGIAVGLLQMFPEVRAMCHSKFRHILVDEFQDTNNAQYALLRLLAGPQTKVFTVGDPNQAVYSWRGANIRNIHEKFVEDFSSEEVLHLQYNYRSVEPIIRAAEAVLCADGAPDLFKPGVPRRPDIEGMEPVVVQSFAVEEDEGQYIVKRIRKLQEERQYKLKDMAILFRQWTRCDPVEAALQAGGIACYRTGRRDLANSKEVQDIMAYLGLFYQPADQKALDRILNVPSRGIGKTTCEELKSLAHRKGQSSVAQLLLGDLSTSQLDLPQLISLLKDLSSREGPGVGTVQPAWMPSTPRNIAAGEIPPRARPGIMQLRQIVFVGRCAAAYLPLDLLVDVVMEISQYKEMLLTEQEKHPGGPKRLQNIQRFKTAVCDANFTQALDQADALDLALDDPDLLEELALSQPHNGADSPPEDDHRRALQPVLQYLEQLNTRGGVRSDRMSRLMVLVRDNLEIGSLDEVEEQDQPALIDQVTLTTLHAAKGREFPVVFIIGCEDGRWPVSWCNNFDEERRLAYVGMTRAKDHLCMTCAQARAKDDETLPPSPYWRAVRRWLQIRSNV